MSADGAHYEAVAEAYGEADFYRQGPYRDWQLGVIRAALRLEAGAVLADIGGGNGDFSLACLAGVANAALEVVEPSAAMRRGGAAGAAGVTFVAQDAVEWAGDAGGSRVSRVLLKEVVHHLDRDARRAFFAGARSRRLADGGRVLVVTRPKDAIDYPMWDAAKAVWAAHQPSEHDIEADLREAGFSRVATSVEAYEMEMPLARWLDLVRGRFWSTFAKFDDAELRAGCDAIRAAAAPDAAGAIRFAERLVLIDAAP